jgi:very-short-patch-repair endonuclease
MDQDKKDYSGNLHKDAWFSTYRNARELRHTETQAEKKLWPHLRNRQLKGKKFRRQHALDKYVLDFYCHECKLSVELDGEIHNEKMNRQYDEARTSTLNDFGIMVIRFRNEEVMNDVEKVLKKIAEYLTSPFQ